MVDLFFMISGPFMSLMGHKRREMGNNMQQIITLYTVI